MKILPIGTIGKAHGLRGEVVIHPAWVESPLWSKGTAVFLLPPPPEGGERAGETALSMEPPPPLVTLLKVRRQPPGQLVASLEGYASRDAAESLRGTRLGVSPEALPEPAQDEVYHHEVGGWAVAHVDGTPIGVAGAMLPLPAQDVLEVILPGGEVGLVPFVGAIVVDVDRSARRIIIDPPRGLLPGDPD